MTRCSMSFDEEGCQFLLVVKDNSECAWTDNLLRLV